VKKGHNFGVVYVTSQVPDEQNDDLVIKYGGKDSQSLENKPQKPTVYIQIIIIMLA